MNAESKEKKHAKTVTLPKSEVIKRLALNESGFVFDPVMGNSFTVNSTGFFILKKLQTHITVAKLLQAIQDEYDVPLADAEHDVIEFSALLRNTFN